MLLLLNPRSPELLVAALDGTHPIRVSAAHTLPCALIDGGRVPARPGCGVAGVGCGVLLRLVVQLRVFAAAKALQAGAAHGESRRTWCKLAIVWPCIVSAVRSDDDMTSPALSVKLYLCTHHGATVRHGGNYIHATDNKTASRSCRRPGIREGRTVSAAPVSAT